MSLSYLTSDVKGQYVILQIHSQIRGKGSSDLFTTLSKCKCVSLHWIVLKLAKVIKISNCNRTRSTLKCCWPMLEKNVDKKHIILDIWTYMTG